MSKNKQLCDVIVPSFRFSDEELAIFNENISRLGFFTDTKIPLKSNKYAFYGSPQIRASFVNKSFNSKNKFIFSLKGGYGAVEILNLLDFKSYNSNNKLLMGFSDVTAILNAIYKKTKCISIHGPNLGSLTRKLSNDEISKILSALNKDDLVYDVDFSRSYNVDDDYYEGIAVGGNLVILCDLIGTDYEIDLTDKIVFLECQNTKGYRIYVKLVQLFLTSHSLKNCKCVVLGNFLNCDESDKYIKLFFSRYNIPCFHLGNFGHGSSNYSFYLGGLAILDLNTKKLLSKHN